MSDEQLRALRDRAWALYATACQALGFYAAGGKCPPETTRQARYEIPAHLEALAGWDAVVNGGEQ